MCLEQRLRKIWNYRAYWLKVLKVDNVNAIQPLLCLCLNKVHFKDEKVLSATLHFFTHFKQITFFIIQQIFILMTLSASPVTVSRNFQYTKCIPCSLKMFSEDAITRPVISQKKQNTRSQFIS